MDVAACRVHKLVADVTLVAEGQVLMVRYRDTSRYDHQSGWFLPDDYLNPYEHPDDAARRILQDQVGMTIPAARLDRVESFGNGAWHLIFHYHAEIEQALPPVPGANTAEARWFALAALPDRSEVVHHGWGLDVLATILHRPSA